METVFVFRFENWYAQMMNVRDALILMCIDISLVGWIVTLNVYEDKVSNESKSTGLCIKFVIHDFEQ